MKEREEDEEGGLVEIPYFILKSLAVSLALSIWRISWELRTDSSWICRRREGEVAEPLYCFLGNQGGLLGNTVSHLFCYQGQNCAFRCMNLTAQGKLGIATL